MFHKEEIAIAKPSREETLPFSSYTRKNMKYNVILSNTVCPTSEVSRSVGAPGPAWGANQSLSPGLTLVPCSLWLPLLHSFSLCLDCYFPPWPLFYDYIVNKYCSPYGRTINQKIKCGSKKQWFYSESQQTKTMVDWCPKGKKKKIFP